MQFVTMGPDLLIREYTFYVLGQNGWGTKIMSELVTVTIVCDA